MKWSKYNYIYRSKTTNGWILYNSVSGALITLDRENYEILRRLRANPDAVGSFSNSDELIDAHILVHDDRIEIDKIKLKLLQNRLSNGVLDLAIAPTLACNFACSYCFQQGIPRQTMDDETERNIVCFIDLLSKRAELLKITWFGGEPLLALGRLKSLCQRILRDVKIPFVSRVITNGYLLNSDTVHALSDVRVTDYQITIDGLEGTHNRRRPLHNKKPTFKKLIANIESLEDEAAVAIRVNIDRDNMHEYHALYKYLHERFRRGNVIVYPGFTDCYSYACSAADSCSLSRQERAQFVIDLYNKHGIYSEGFYPTITYQSCMARRVNSFAIGPRGELYKCLSLFGVDQMSIGNVNNNGDAIKNEDLMVAFLKGHDHLDSPKCARCLLFPACNGGCPYLKMKEELFGEVHDTCHVAKGRLNEFLEMRARMKDAGRRLIV